MNSIPVTRVALLTPTGRGAIATLLVRGPAAVSAVSRYFSPAFGDRLDASPIDVNFNRPRFGRWNGTAGEELIVCLLDAENVEVHCHGGIAAARAIQTALVAAGCEAVDFLDAEILSEPDPIRRAAVGALLQVATERCAAILLDQHAGALRKQVEAIRAAIEDNDLARATSLLDELLAASRIGLHLVEPFRVVLVGAPNVGKSSLINRLMGYERSIVHGQPGTTRDLVTSTTAIDGWPVELIDSAGLHDSTDPLELAGISRARTQADTADLVVFVVDRSAVDNDFEHVAITDWKNVLRVENKCDLPAANAGKPVPADCRTSAATNEGISALVAKIATRLVPSPPHQGAAVPFTPTQVHALEAAGESLRSGRADDAKLSLSTLLAD